MKYKTKEYAIYKGDTFIALGTTEELAEYLGVSPNTIRFYATAKYKERHKSGKQLCAFKIEDDEDDTRNIQERQTINRSIKFRR